MVQMKLRYCHHLASSTMQCTLTSSSLKLFGQMETIFFLQIPNCIEDKLSLIHYQRASMGVPKLAVTYKLEVII